MRCLGAAPLIFLPMFLAAAEHAAASTRHRLGVRGAWRGSSAPRPARIAGLLRAGGLRLRADGSFKVLQVADTHFGENHWDAWGAEQDANTTRLLRGLLRAEDPDLVVFSGDQISANNIYKNATAFWRLPTALAEEAARPHWVALFGNHDDMPLDSGAAAAAFHVREGTPAQTSRRDLLAYSAARPRCATPRMYTSRAGGAGIGYLLLRAPGNGAPPVAVLWFLDTGGGSLPQALEEDQLTWLQSASVELAAAHGTLPGLAFLHIPLPEYRETVGPASGGESQRWSCFGMAADGGVAPVHRAPRGALAALAAAGTRAVTAGHNHGNDYCCTAAALPALCFGRHSGYGGYNHGWERGARAFTLHVPRAPLAPCAWNLTTHVRLESGAITNVGQLGAC
eukprot:jgi/Tetstr1/441616/TSEL_029843.t1